MWQTPEDDQKIQLPKYSVEDNNDIGWSDESMNNSNNTSQEFRQKYKISFECLQEKIIKDV